MPQHSNITTERVNVNVGDIEVIDIEALGDIHLGARSCNKNALQVFVDRIRNKPKNKQTFIILMGDVFDAISVQGDKRFNIGDRDTQLITVDNCLDYFTNEVLRPLQEKCNVKIVGSICGNHEAKFCHGDLDLIYQLYQRVGIKHLGIKSFIHFYFKYKSKVDVLRCLAFHGSKNSTTELGKLKVLRDFRIDNSLTYEEALKSIPILLYGHTHTCKVDKIDRVYPDPKNKRMCVIPQWNCLTGTFLDTANFNTSSYGTRQGYSSVPVGYIHIEVGFNPCSLKVEAETDHGLNPNVETILWNKS